MTVNTYKGDSVIVDVTVKENSVAKNISGGTVDAAVRSPGGTITGVTSAITDAANGVARFTCPVATLDETGVWLAELELVIGSESQTVWSESLYVSDAILVD